MTTLSAWMIESLESFIEQLSLSKSKPTVDAYRFDVATLLQYLSEKGIKRMSSLRPDHLISYLGYQKSRGKSDASIYRYHTAIRSYCRFLKRSKYLSEDLTEDINPPVSRQKAPYIPSISEIEAILKQPREDSESGVRDRAILELLYSSGLRASELCDLMFNDWQGDRVIIRCGKRSKTRTIPITENAQNAIQEYVNKYRGTKQGILFRTKLGKQMRRQLLCALVSEYAYKAGLEDVTTHTLRHACATHLLDEGADLRMIQEVLGHSSIASTQRYTHLSSNKIQQMFQNFHPRKTEKIEAAI